MRLGKAKGLAAVSLMSVLVMILAACGGTSGGGGATALPTSQQILKWNLVPNAVDISTMDPALTLDFYSQQAQMLMFPLLYVYDNNLNYIPWAADGMPQISNGGTTYTIKIKSGLKWSDGTAIDANTYVYSINRSDDPCTNNGKSIPNPLFLSTILGASAFNGGGCKSPSGNNPATANSPLIGQGKGLYAPDPQTLVITLTAPYAYFLGDLTTSQYAAQPKQLITQFGFKDWTNHLTDNGGFGGGNFNLTQWTHQGNMTYKANSAEQQILDGKTSKLSEIDVTVYKDPKTQYNDFLSGTQNVGFPSSTQYATAKSKPNFHQIPWLDVGYLAPTWTEKPFDNVLARQAFDVALNRTALAAVVKNIVIPSCHIIPQGSLGYNSSLTCADGTTLAGDPQKATQLITQYAQTACGGQISSCTPVTFVDSNSTDEEAVDAVIMAEWRAALPGYPITLKNEDFNTLLSAVYGGSPPQIYGIGYSVDYNDMQDWTSLQFSAGNVQGVNDTTATPLFTAGDTDQNPTDRIQKYQQAEQALVNDGAWMTLSQQQVIWNTSANLVNFNMTSAGYPSPLMFDVVYLTNAK